MFRRATFRVSTLSLFILGILGLVASESFVSAGKAEDAKKYTEQLKTSKDPKKRAEAIVELGKLGQIMKSFTEAALPDIMKGLDDKEAVVREAAALAYGQLDPDPADAVPTLVKMVKEDKETIVKIAAINGLAAMGNKAKAALPTIRDVMKNEDKKSEMFRKAQTAAKSITAK
jgi:HEAT repeat protein